MAIAGNLLSANAESIETDTSAWSALVNATGLAQGGGGTAGTKCLLFKSVASGDTQIGLTTRVDVVAGSEYWSCASVFPPAAGAQARIEVRWYTSGGTLISTSQGPLTTAPSGTWFQVGVVGTAPANAATALVVIRATATAANQSWFTDRIFLGLTTPSTGNLLPFNTETIEQDTTGWFAATNCTLGVSTAAFTFFQSLLVTSSAAGAVMARTALSQAPGVTPGVEYAAYAQVTPGTAGLPVKIEIYWRDAVGTEISTSSATWTPPANQWTRIVVVATAPPGASVARIAVSPTASAAGQQWAVDRAVLAPTSALKTSGNLLPYNTSDIEQDTSGWTVTGGTKSQTTEQTLGGGYALKLVADGTATLTATVTVPVDVTGGLGYQFVPCSSQSVARTYQTRIEWLDAAGTVVRKRWSSWIGRTTGWLASGLGDLAPDTAVAARLSFLVPDVPAGEVWYLDRVEWRIGGLTARAVPAGGGGAAITLRGLTSGGPTWKWTLERILPGQTPQPVRGWTSDLKSQTITGDIAVATDYEAPLGVPVQWRASIRPTSGLGALSYTSDPITLDAETTEVWLKDPGLPQRSVRVTVATPMPTWQYASRRGVSAVHGRALPVVISSTRGGRTGDLTVVTETDADKAALSWVLSSGNTLLLQWPPGWGEEDMYVAVGDINAAPVVEYAEFHDRTWVLPLTQVDRPIGGVTGSADRTWQTVSESATTWDEALATAATWLDVYTGA
ncbi:hypothetical protein ABZ446_28390 [Streptomyces sp. NPDC005813]|uniref:hypothetical protein n=1 Tax=Streptomyces sp. NPDC005813 TaxID=3155592 RepID=UPI0033CA8BB2